VHDGLDLFDLSGRVVLANERAVQIPGRQWGLEDSQGELWESQGPPREELDKVGEDCSRVGQEGDFEYWGGEGIIGNGSRMIVFTIV